MSLVNDNVLDEIILRCIFKHRSKGTYKRYIKEKA